MHRRLWVVVGIVVLAIAGNWLFTRVVFTLRLPVVTPEEPGLVWRECPLENGHDNRSDFEKCLGPGQPVNPIDEAEPKPNPWVSGANLITIGQDRYEAGSAAEFVGTNWYSLYRNGSRVKTYLRSFTAFSPNISLKSVGGRVVWEVSDGTQATVFYGNRDLRQFYGLSGAYRPYGLNGKLIFIGRRDGEYFVIYDGKRITPKFEKILIAYCCEPAMYSPRVREGRYIFLGIRAGKEMVVEVYPSMEQ